MEIVHNEDLRKQMLTLQKKYDNEKLRMENEQIKLEKESVLLNTVNYYYDGNFYRNNQD